MTERKKGEHKKTERIKERIKDRIQEKRTNA
jgi:hypothetical protein